jgi:hypothetical protein
MDPLNQSLSSLTNRRAVAFCKNLPLARSLSDSLCKTLGVTLTLKRVDRYTDLRAFVGDPHNPISFGVADFQRVAESGGLLLIEVLETSAKVIGNLAERIHAVGDTQRIMGFTLCPTNFI